MVKKKTDAYDLRVPRASKRLYESVVKSAQENKRTIAAEVEYQLEIVYKIK